MPRLIDADALPIHQVKILHDEGLFIGDIVFSAHITNAPTIDAEPVRHGRWVAIDRIASGFPWKLRCNRCGVPQDYPHTYCPNCGAKMDGGAE